MAQYNTNVLNVPLNPIHSFIHSACTYRIIAQINYFWKSEIYWKLCPDNKLNWEASPDVVCYVRIQFLWLASCCSQLQLPDDNIPHSFQYIGSLISNYNAPMTRTVWSTFMNILVIIGFLSQETWIGSHISAILNGFSVINV